MNLKCIGGPCDGQVQFVNDDLETGVCVKVCEPTEFKVANFNESLNAYREGRTPESMSIRYYLYRICSLHCTSIDGEKLTLKYLCIDDWHEWEAIQHQFRK